MADSDSDSDMMPVSFAMKGAVVQIFPHHDGDTWEYITDVMTDTELEHIRERYYILGVYPLRIRADVMHIAVWMHPRWKDYTEYATEELGFA